MSPLSSRPDFQFRSICVIGICTVDAVGRYVDEYPSRGGLTFFDELTFTTGGNAVNCSIALRRMGFAVGVVTKVGQDTSGDLVLAELKRHGVETSGVIRSGDAHTSFSFVCVHSDGQRSFLHTVGTNGTFRLEEIDIEIVRAADLVLVTGTMLLPALDGEPTAELLRSARAAGATTLLDTSYIDGADQARWRAAIEPCLPHLDYFVPSRLEARALTGQDEPAQAARLILAAGCRNAVVKLDREGVYYHEAAGDTGRVPAYQVETIVDTTGAGDCWCAGFLAGLAQAAPLREALLLGNAVAAHGIQHAGASSGIPPLSQIRTFQTNTPVVRDATG
ncbi:MAG: carbohydrate kinase family protein [Planctomycetes bacterium]|nr:carbohydrate kinase family protein [Planctomycetota bacterium]